MYLLGSAISPSKKTELSLKKLWEVKTQWIKLWTFLSWTICMNVSIYWRGAWARVKGVTLSSRSPRITLNPFLFFYCP